MMVNPIFYDSDKEAIAALEAEGRRLKYIATKVWRQYLSSYQPTQYKRTRDAQKSIKLTSVERDGINGWMIKVTFVDELAWHDSVLKGSQPQAHAIMMISQGWNQSRSTTKLTQRTGRQIYRFTYYEGFDYIDKVIKEFNRGNKSGVRLEVQWKGKPFDPNAKNDFTR